MSIETSYRLHVVGEPLRRDVVLPPLPGSGTYEPGVLDRAGERVQRSLPLVLAAGVGGAAGGSKLLRLGGGGLVRGIAGGILGAVTGALAGAAMLATIGGTGEHRRPEGGGTVAATDVLQRERVKVMTWNVHGGMGGPGEFWSSDAELDELADVIRREQPDVLLLQEVDRFATRSNHVDVLRELDDRLGARSAVGATAMTTLAGRDQEVALLTFNGFEVQDARNVVHPDARGGGLGVRIGSWIRDARTAVGSLLGRDWSHGSGYMVRNSMDAIVRTPAGTAVRVLNGHYQWPTAGMDHQGRQVGALAGAVDAWDGPTIWGGDFNVRNRSRHGERERRLLAEAGLVDGFDAVDEARRVPPEQRGTSVARPTHAQGGIDRIYASRHARAIDVRIVREAGDASDHLPVVAEYELVPNRP